MSKEPISNPEIKKAWKVWGKNDDEYTKHYADTFHAPTRNDAKMQWAARNGEDYMGAVVYREPCEDLRLFEGEWISETSYRWKIFNRERKAMIDALDDNAIFCVQDKRSYVGNDVVWWAKDGNGYTTNFDELWVLSGIEIKEHQWRETDVIWPHSVVVSGIRRHVDMQYLDKNKSI